jgi:hypothetical protein
MHEWRDRARTRIHELEKLALMVALNRSRVQLKHAIEHPNRVRPATDQITDENHRIARCHAGFGEQFIEFFETAMNVAYDKSVAHATSTIAQPHANARLLLRES